jgi:hypothetical protein
VVLPLLLRRRRRLHDFFGGAARVAAVAPVLCHDCCCAHVLQMQRRLCLLIERDAAARTNAAARVNALTTHFFAFTAASLARLLCTRPRASRLSSPSPSESSENAFVGGAI